MQRLITRFGLRAVAGLVVAVICIAAASLILAVSYRDQVSTLRRTIYQRCLQRAAYDHAAFDTARADLAEQKALIRVIGLRRGTADTQLVAIFRHKAARDRAVLARGVIGGCAVFK